MQVLFLGKPRVRCPYCGPADDAYGKVYCAGARSCQEFFFDNASRGEYARKFGVDVVENTGDAVDQDDELMLVWSSRAENAHGQLAAADEVVAEVLLEQRDVERHARARVGRASRWTFASRGASALRPSALQRHPAPPRLLRRQ